MLQENVAATSSNNVKADSLKGAYGFLASQSWKTGSYRNLLNAHKLKRSRFLTAILQTQFNHLAYALHEGVKIPSLGMTSPQSRHSGDIVALLVPLDQHRELARGLHKEDSSTGRMPRFSRWIAKAAVSPWLLPIPIFLPASQRTNKSSQSHGGNSECGISRSARAGCRRGGRSPSLRWGFSGLRRCR